MNIKYSMLHVKSATQWSKICTGTWIDDSDDSAVVSFSSCPHPNATISRESPVCWGELSTLSWAQHNQGSWDFHVGTGELTQNKSSPLTLCRLEKLVMAEAALQSFLGSVNAIFLAMEVAVALIEGVNGQTGTQNTCPFLTWSLMEVLQVVSGELKPDPPTLWRD